MPLSIDYTGGALTDIRTGIGPETFGWKTADGNFSGPTLTAEQEAYYQVIRACDALCDATETVFRKLDTILSILITTSDPKFSNPTFMPGE